MLYPTNHSVLWETSRNWGVRSSIMKGMGLAKVFKLRFKFDTKSYKDTKNLVLLGDWDADRRQGSEPEQRQPVIIEVQFFQSPAKRENLDEEEWVDQVSADYFWMDMWWGKLHWVYFWRSNSGLCIFIHSQIFIENLLYARHLQCAGIASSSEVFTI